MSQASWGCHVHTPPSPSSVPSLNSASITGVPLWPGTVNGARTKHRLKGNHANIRQTRWRSCSSRICREHKLFKLCGIGRARKLNANKYNNITNCVILQHSIIGLFFYVTHLFLHSLYKRKKKGNNPIPRRTASKHCNTIQSVAPDPVTSQTFALKTLHLKVNTWSKPVMTADLIRIAHNNRCRASEPKWEGEAVSAYVSYHHF